MKYVLKAGLACAAFGMVCGASAWSFDPQFLIHTAVQDYSNLDVFSGTRYEVVLNHSASDADLYINGINFLPGAGWDSNIGVSVPTGQMDTNLGPYVFGSPISGDTFLYLYNQAFVGQVDGSVTPGIYSFDLQYIGGEDNSATDVLETLSYQIEVVPFINVAAQMSVNPALIMQGQSTDMSMKVTNNGNRDFISSTWYVASGTGDPGFSDLNLDAFIGDWFDKVLTPGQDRTDLHTRWSATGSTPPGVYTSWGGVIGGFHPGDDMAFRGTNATLVVAVPEPGAIIALAMGGALLVARRRKN